MQKTLIKIQEQGGLDSTTPQIASLAAQSYLLSCGLSVFLVIQTFSRGLTSSEPI